MALRLLISPTTSAVTSDSFTAFGDNNTGLTCSNLGAGETLTLQVYDVGLTGGAGWTDVIVNGSLFECDINNNLMVIQLDSLTYRVVKSATANPVGVGITQTQQN